jgi:hypothetical protein
MTDRRPTCKVHPDTRMTATRDSNVWYCYLCNEHHKATHVPIEEAGVNNIRYKVVLHDRQGIVVDEYSPQVYRSAAERHAQALVDAPDSLPEETYGVRVFQFDRTQPKVEPVCIWAHVVPKGATV